MGFISWASVTGRSREIAAALDGEACTPYDARLRRRSLTPVRYIQSLGRTAWFLARRRPRAVIVTNPPVWPAVLAWAYGRVTGAPLVLDSHPASFGAKGNRQGRLVLPVHRWLARRAVTTLVTTEDWVAEVARWGGQAAVLHEAPGDWELSPPPGRDGPLRVLFVGIFSSDEPVGEVVEAARLSPEVELAITGDLGRAPAGLVEGAPANVRFVGYLGPDDYVAAVHDAHALLCLTTEPTSVMRSAYEAVWAGRPLVLTDWPVLRRLFPQAVPTTNTAEGIAAALGEVEQRWDELVAAAPAARARQERRWEDQLVALRHACRARGSRAQGLRG